MFMLKLHMIFSSQCISFYGLVNIYMTVNKMARSLVDLVDPQLPFCQNFTIIFK